MGTQTHSFFYETRTPYLYVHLRGTESKKLIRRVLRLTKSSRTARRRRERRLSLKNIPPF
jgi:hypothetical protein